MSKEPIECYHCHALLVERDTPHQPGCPVPALIAAVLAEEPPPAGTAGLVLGDWGLDAEGCWRIDGRHCWVWMQARPYYCDRGRWLAHVERRPGATSEDLHMDGADGWPRYYFDLERAKLEVEAWLRKRREIS